MWFRFLTVHPERLLNGIEKDLYLVARMTTNPVYDDTKIGDRALIVF